MTIYCEKHVKDEDIKKKEEIKRKKNNLCVSEKQID